MKKIIIHWKDHVLKLGLLVVAGFMQQVAYGQYCTPYYDSPCYLGLQIENLQLVGENGTSIDDQATGCLGGYDDRTAISPVKLYPNNMYSVNIASAASYGQGVSIWIDFNDNDAFESSEMVGTNLYVDAAGIVSISIPVGANLGSHRMRVMLAYNNGATNRVPITDPCVPTNANDNGVSYGETHDYTVEIIAKPVCSGVYNAGTASAVTTICSGFDFDLNTDANLPNLDGLTGQWQAYDGTNWNVVGTTIAGTYNLVGGISQNTLFRFVTTCSFTSSTHISDTVAVAINTNYLACYCTPVYTDDGCAYGMFINDFVLTGENGTAISDIGTGCSTNSYDDRTAESVDLYTNSTYSANVTSNANYWQGTTVWIDFNDNGVFESSENVGSTNNVVASGNFPISIPVGATVGNHRMRVMLAYNNNVVVDDPCSPPLGSDVNKSYGETHDYTVVISPKPDCAGMPNAGTISSSVVTICPSIDFDLATDVVFPNVNGLTGQWQAFDGTNWNDIASANAVDYTVAGGISQNTDYRFIATCSVSNQADTSNIVSVTMKNYTECYCEPVYTYGCQDLGAGEFVGINDFMLTGEYGTEIADLGTGCSTNSYDDRTTESVDLFDNSTYSAYISSNSNYGGEVAAVWIDFNDNGIFENTERVGYTSSAIGYGTTFNINIPLGADLGSHRMRVMLGFDDNADATTFDACTAPYSNLNSNSYGEVHDYTVNILCNPNFVVNLGADDAYCVGTAYTKTLDAGTFTDVTYTWSDGSTNQTLVADTAGTYSVVVALSNGCTAKDTVVITENALPVVNLGLDTAICTGSTLTLDAQNTGATFTWSDNSTAQTFAVTTAGTYNVTVEDANGCIGTDAINVSINTLPVVNLGLDTAICVGATLTLDAQNAGATFLWSDNSTNQTLAVTSAGTYSVTVTNANGCSATDDIVVTENTLPVVDLGLDTAICAGATLTLDAQNAGSTYLWSDGSTAQTLAVTTADTYSVTVTNANGCSSSDDIVVTENTLPVVNLGADTAICAGATLTLDAENAGATFLWSNSSTTQTLAVTSAGTYSVTVTNVNGCIAKDTVVVTTNPLPTAGSLSATNDVCAFDFGVTGVTGATSYEWNFGDNNTATTTTAFTSHEYENEGTYTVTVKVKNACGEVEKQVEVTCNEVSVKDVANANRIAMYPNPTSSVVTLDASVEMTEITVVDNLGKVVYRVSPNHTMSYQMNVSELSNGFYTVIITTNSGVVTKKLEVTK